MADSSKMKACKLPFFMARRPGWERPISEGGATWIHFGANIGAADGELSLQTASDDLRQLTEAELARAGQAPGIVGPKTLVPSGETPDLHRAAGRYVTLVGSNPLFHLPQDRWPHAVDTDVVTRVAAAAAALVVKLTRWGRRKAGTPLALAGTPLALDA